VISKYQTIEIQLPSIIPKKLKKTILQSIKQEQKIHDMEEKSKRKLLSRDYYTSDDSDDEGNKQASRRDKNSLQRKSDDDEDSLDFGSNEKRIFKDRMSVSLDNSNSGI
jgi:hypothetical protein